MHAVASPQANVDAYLAELRARLCSLPQDQTTEIIKEIRSHIRDAASARGGMTEAGVNAILSRLGPAATLAASYVTDALLTRAERKRMPWTILRAVFHWATLSVKGFLLLLLCVSGYLFGASFFLAALAKPFNPKVGVWLIDEGTYSLVLGMTNRAPQGHELLGWKIIPIGFALGGGTILLTSHFAQWSIRRFRETKQAWRTRQ
jgi:hypothetical protein